ncbi:MAG: DedA family protein [Alphaproteobacteria bacterium]|nr:DedA family protein [Alphaproteobacteria bacterium]
MIRALYDWTMRQAGSADAPKALAVVAFAESSFFPIPPDVLLVPMVLADRARAWFFAGLCTVASVVGGLGGYAIGFYFFETVGRWVIEFYGLQKGFETFKAAYADWGLWIILIKGLTPIPFKVVTIASGAASFDLVVFTLASIVTRGARFYMVAALIRRFGAPIREFIERRLTLVTTVFAVCLVGGFVVIRYLLPKG